MKRFTYLLLGIVVLFTLSACSSPKEQNDAPFTITKAKVFITHDKSLLGSTGAKDDNGKEKQIVSNALYYKLDIKNNQKENLHLSGNDEIDLRLIPDDSLKNTSKDIVGVNIFSPNNKVYAKGISIQDFNSAKKGKIEFFYEVGATEENNEIPLSPSKAELEKLKKEARHGILVIYRNNKEIARYDLDTLKPGGKSTN
ncbi:hypothetical protein CN918_30845 [Priestia megaterium]|nr:hypothetical protein CN918_30845 [Priestia megaterium]